MRDEKGRFKKVKIERDLTKIIDLIGASINEISTKGIGNLFGDELSKKALHLATMKSFLGQSLADMEFTLNMTEADRKARWTSFFMEAKRSQDKITVMECSSIADVAIKDVLNKEIELKGQVQKIKNLRQDVSDIITTIQTRINALKSERIESNL